jgi:hypothetical protein
LIANYQQGELALKFGFNESKELEIQRYLEPRNGESFCEDEIKEAYIAALDDSEAMKNDSPAQVLFNEFVRPNRKQRRSGVNYDVFTWDEHIPEHLSYLSQQKLNRGKIPAHKPSKASCTCCQAIQWIMSGNKNKGPSKNMKGKKQASKKVPATSTPIWRVFAGKKYKQVALKVRPVYTDLPERFRIKREIRGDPPEGTPGLAPNPF